MKNFNEMDTCEKIGYVLGCLFLFVFDAVLIHYIWNSWVACVWGLDAMPYTIAFAITWVVYTFKPKKK